MKTRYAVSADVHISTFFKFYYIDLFFYVVYIFLIVLDVDVVVDVDDLVVVI